MAKTGAQIEQDVLDILVRDSTSAVTLADLAVKSAYTELQVFRDWDAQKKTYRRLSDVDYRFALPTTEGAFKSPRQLFRVKGTVLTSDLLPALPSTDSINASPFYRRTSFEEVLHQRAVVQSQTNNSSTPNTILTQQQLYTIDNGFIEITPKVNDASNQFALMYYAIIDYVDATADWFTNNCYEYLTLKALIFMVTAMGEVDERVGSWRTLANDSLKKCLGFDIALDIGGDSLVMRG